MSNPAVSNRQIVAIIMIVVIGGVVPSLQPLLLGTLMAEGMLTLSQIGQAATTEILGMALAAGLAGIFLPTHNLRWIMYGCGLVGIACNLTTTMVTGSSILAVRFVAGLSEGLMLWLIMSLLASLKSPGRPYGVYVASEAIASFACAALLSFVILGRFGAGGGYIFLLILSGLIILGANFIPQSLPALPRRSSAARVSLPDAKGFIGLMAIFCHQSALMALWVYVLPLGAEMGQTDDFSKFALTLAVGAQIIGGVSSVVLAPHLNAWRTTVLGSTACAIIVASFTVTGLPAPLFMAALCLLGFAWFFLPAFQLLFLGEVDVTRRSATFTSTAQLCGAACGPAISAFVVSDGSVGNVPYLSAGLFFLAVTLMALLSLTRQRAPDAIMKDIAVQEKA